MRDLQPVFDAINAQHFDGGLDPLELRWNSRLRSAAGRFMPGSRKYFLAFKPRIEVASYLLDEAQAETLIHDTIGHEMIHYWLWLRRRPYGHTPEFYAKMRQMGVSRYNPVPKVRPFRYLYRCLHCRKAFPARRKLGVLACLGCCKSFSGGRFDPRFKLVFEKELV